MRAALIALTLLGAAAPAFSQDAAPAASSAAPVAHRGVMLRDVNNVRLAAVDSVRPDGSVGIIIESHYVIIPADTLSATDGKLTTKLTKAEVKRIK